MLHKELPSGQMLASRMRFHLALQVELNNRMVLKVLVSDLLPSERMQPILLVF